MAHIGVENRTKENQVLTHDGKTLWFKPGEVRLVEGVSPDFVESRVHLSHPTKVNPKTGLEEQSQVIQGLRLFNILTIDEALKKGARPDEDPRAVAARVEAERKRKERRELLDELKTSLVEDGWTPPTVAGKEQQNAGKEVATDEEL